jgi:hypothetical protein
VSPGKRIENDAVPEGAAFFVARSMAKKKKIADLRAQINVAALIEALEQHVLGEKEMTATQVSAALALLKKTLPDLSEPVRKLLTAQEATPHEDALQELE